MKQEAEHILKYIVERFSKIGDVFYQRVEIVQYHEKEEFAVMEVILNIEIANRVYGTSKTFAFYEFNQFYQPIVSGMILELIRHILEGEPKFIPFESNPLTKS